MQVGLLHQVVAVQDKLALVLLALLLMVKVVMVLVLQ
jgi:hypothetical protein